MCVSVYVCLVCVPTCVKLRLCNGDDGDDDDSKSNPTMMMTVIVIQQCCEKVQ